MSAINTQVRQIGGSNYLQPQRVHAKLSPKLEREEPGEDVELLGKEPGEAHRVSAGV